MSDMPRLWWSPSEAARHPNTVMAGIRWFTLDGKYIEPPDLPADAVELIPTDALTCTRACSEMHTFDPGCALWMPSGAGPRRRTGNVRSLVPADAPMPIAEWEITEPDASLADTDTTTEWAITYGEATPPDVLPASEADVRGWIEFARDYPHMNARAWSRTVSRSPWQEASDD